MKSNYEQELNNMLYYFRLNTTGQGTLNLFDCEEFRGSKEANVTN